MAVELLVIEQPSTNFDTTIHFMSSDKIKDALQGKMYSFSFI